MGHLSAHSKAISLGYRYVRGNGKSAGNTWMARFQKTDDPGSPTAYVGWDRAGKRWLVEYEDTPETPIRYD